MTNFASRLDTAIKNSIGYPNLSKETGIATTTLHGYKKGSSEPKASALLAIAQSIGVDPGWLLTGKDSGNEEVHVPMYDLKLGAGSGPFFERAKLVDHIPFLKSYLLSRTGRADGKNLAIFQATGDSMSPTIDDGDIFMVDLKNKNSRDGVFAFVYENEARVKRLQFGFQGVTVISDNADLYPAELLTDEAMNNIQIIGRAIWHSGKL